MTWLEPIELHGKYAFLQPLSHRHHNDLAEAASDGELWKLWYTFVPEPSKMMDAINQRLTLQESGSMIPFAVIEPKTNKAVGITTYLNIDCEHRRLEIGGNWYRKSVQRTALNTECKLMMLTYAFETLNCIAVEFRTHFFNEQSRKAIERIGAKLDGILRNHMIMPNNTLRDTCVYSIIASEWPTVKAHLKSAL
ncbi:MAG: GNAT family N-acetyltransferase [Gammaproteobacteria bacterium]|nr:GNAT family N-acetyltransferase [Gammaproteobacteria bacterium]